MSAKETENNIKENGKTVNKNIAQEQNETEKTDKKKPPVSEPSSQENEKGQTETQPQKQTEQSQPEFKKQLEELQARNLELNDKYLRLYSDFDNFRKRVTKERVELIKYAGEEVVTLLLPVLDDFERAIKSSENSENCKAVKEGIRLIYQKMKNILTNHGLKEMEIKDGEFNSDLHDAITKVPAPAKEQIGKITEVIEKGYYLNDKVIRHAKVVVGT